MAESLSAEEFHREVQSALELLPEMFRNNIENLHIVVEAQPSALVVKGRRGGLLLGLYEGTPLNKRGSWYGMYPVVPDRITLYQENLERISDSPGALRNNIRDTLIHEVGHYFGMTEQEIRAAGY